MTPPAVIKHSYFEQARMFFSPRPKVFVVEHSTMHQVAHRHDDQPIDHAHWSYREEFYNILSFQTRLTNGLLTIEEASGI